VKKKEEKVTASTKVTVRNVKAFVTLFNTFSIFGKSMMMKECVELMFAGGKLVVKGNNGELKMARAYTVDHGLLEKPNQSILVPYTRLSQSLKWFKGDVDVTVVEDDGGIRLLIEQDDKEYKITGEKVEEPISFVKKHEKTIRISSDIFKAGLRKTLSFTEPVNTMRIAMTGIKMVCKSRVLTFWGTRGTIACRFDVGVEFDDEFAVLVPPATAKLLLDIDTKEFELSIDEAQIHIDYADGLGVMESALITEPYPNIEAVVDEKVKEATNQFVIAKTVLEDLFHMANIYANDLAHDVLMIVTHDRIECRGEDLDFGVNCRQWSGGEHTLLSPILTKISAVLMSTALSVIDTENVIVSVLDRGNQNAFVITPDVEEPNVKVLALVMPQRIDEFDETYEKVMQEQGVEASV
jgi:hypothetical protein